MGGLFGNFSKVKNIFDLLILYKASRNNLRSSCLIFFFSFSSTHPLTIFIFFQVLLYLKFCSTYFLLAIKVCFLNSCSCSSCFIEGISLMNMWYLRYHFLCMNSCLFMFNWYELREKWKHEPRFFKEKQNRRNRTPWTCFCFNISGFDTVVFAFFWYFS